MKILRKLFKKRSKTMLDVKFVCDVCGEKNLSFYQALIHNNKHENGIFYVR